MATSKEAICNSALQKIGGDQITAITDNNRRAKLCNLQYDKVRKRLLRGHPWNFAMQRSLLLEPIIAIANGGLGGVTIAELTHTIQGVFLTGDELLVSATSGAGTDPTFTGQTLPFTAFARVVSPLIISIHPTVEDAIAGTDGFIVSAAGTKGLDLTLKEKNSAELRQAYEVPSSMLRAVREADKSIDWKIEGQHLITDKSTFELLYIADIDDFLLFDESFDELFAMELAVEISYSLVQSLGLKEQLKLDLKEMKKDIRSFDAQEGQPERFEDTTWLNARL